MNKIETSFSEINIPVIKKLFDLYKVFHKLVGNFPKTERFALGEKIERTILDAMELIFMSNEATKYEKEIYLIKAKSKVELLKVLMRLGADIWIIDTETHLKSIKDTQEVSKMLYGWIKSIR